MPAAVHLRRQIREAYATALAGLTTTGARVHQSRLRPQAAADLPCLLVTADDEEVDTGMQGRQARTLSLIVRGLALATASLDDTLDAIALEVETASAAAGTLGGKVPGGLNLKSIAIDFDDTLNKPAGVVTLHYAAAYFTAAGSPGASL